ncbi:response regulator [Bacteroidales bacterium]|nr:response regulator [Bacteroidales bacterium]
MSTTKNKDFTRILIVDDDIEVINLVIEILEKDSHAYTFYHALNGKEAYEVALKFLPDFIITDWEMPKSNGIEFINRLKKNTQTQHIPVIMMTGRMTNSKNLKMAFDVGVTDYIRKPIDDVELIARLRSAYMLSQSYQENIEIKKRELASVSMSIYRNHQFNQVLIKEIEGLTKKSDDIIGLKRNLSEVQKKIALKIDNDSWEQYQNYFLSIHPNFLKNLTSSFPKITPSELKLASLLRLNLGTKEIADITFLSPETIKSSRKQLRQKFNLEPEANLVSFLMQF